MQFLHFLQSLPLWPRSRSQYFAHGVADGKAAAAHSLTTLSADSAQVGEQAIFAASALPGHVAPDDARIYRLGWVEGYRAVSDHASQTSAQ
jgi:hypothetical protein